MKKDPQKWDVRTLRENFHKIDFPQYQREASVWGRKKKQRLIDSILRDFDIASLYFLANSDGSFDCIDGRQRIGAIMAFLGGGRVDEDDGFPLRIENEIVREDDNPFQALDGWTYERISDAADADGQPALNARNQLLGYEITVVMLEGVVKSEFNLQFTRLNVGAILNAGEKLNAMVGAMRKLCFKDPRIGRHRFLEMIGIPNRRFAKEQLAATVLAQVFELEKSNRKEFMRTRHFDLQAFFKRFAEKADIGETEEAWIEEVEATFDWLAENLPRANELLKNRAFAVSSILLAWSRGLPGNPPVAEVFESFLAEFLCRLRWQVKKGLDVDGEYRYLIDFQKHLTQASVEKPAVTTRAAFLDEELTRWHRESRLRGDEEFSARTGEDPSELCGQEVGSAPK